MTTITLSAIELNARRDDVAICNGIKVAAAELPALSGSDKQIAWAETVRAKLIDAMGEAVARKVKLIGANTGLMACAAFDAAVTQANVVLGRIAPLVEARTAAAFWIDNRNSDGLGLMVALTK